ncbi:eIF2A-related protein [Telmatospirillum sp.]|uniref:WD40 repeat domain-containing protein n=1 Tax=Telmatospirillum sp. TaxID=2079197 RepID=UPI00284C3BE1|nr:hypothetical protein [Telmatospirillum sp.]MDR3440798.1 hypothetical protein [Telmatospirillum sp.]
MMNVREYHARNVPIRLCAAFLLLVFPWLSEMAMASAPKVVLEKTFRPGGSPTAIAWSPDGRLLATSDTINLHIVIWDYETATAVHSVNKHYFGGTSVSFTGDGRYVLTSAVSPHGADNPTSFSLIDVATGAVARDVDGPVKNPTHISLNIANELLASASGKYVAVKRDMDSKDRLTIYNQENMEILNDNSTQGGIKAMAFSPRNDVLATISYYGTVIIWDASTGNIVNTIQAHSKTGLALSFDADGRRLVTSGGIGETPDPEAIRVWDTSTWKMLINVADFSNNNLRTQSVSFSPNGKFLATLNYDGKVRLWDANTLSFLSVIDDSDSGGVAVLFSPDSRHLAIARDHKVNVMRIAD